MLNNIRKKRAENIILDIIILAVTLFITIVNIEDYDQVFSSNNVISNKKTFNKMIKQNKKYVTVDLTDASLTRFSLKNDQNNKIEVNTYKLIYDNNILLIFLKENTAVTDKVNGELINLEGEKLEIKNQLEMEEADKNIYSIAFSNENYVIKENTIKLKFIIGISVITLTLIRLIINLFYYINPKKTRTYKKKLKKAS